MNLKIRYYLRLIVAFFTRFRGVLLIGSLFGFLIFFTVSFVAPKFFKGTVSRIGVVGRYHTDDLPDEIIDQIGDGLTTTTPTQNVEPNLAVSWETPDKGKTWIFHLDENKSWQDGEKIKSFDINYQFSDVSLEYVDDSTVKFTLKEPYVPFPSVVSKPVFKRGLLGTGEWKVEKIKLSGGFIQEILMTDKNKNKRKYRFYPTEETAKLAFKLGKIDILQGIYSPNPFSTWKTVNIKNEVNKNQIVTIFFNTANDSLKEKSI